MNQGNSWSFIINKIHKDTEPHHFLLFHILIQNLPRTFLRLWMIKSNKITAELSHLLIQHVLINPRALSESFLNKYRYWIESTSKRSHSLDILTRLSNTSSRRIHVTYKFSRYIHKNIVWDHLYLTLVSAINIKYIKELMASWGQFIYWPKICMSWYQSALED